MEASRRKVIELNIDDVLPNRFQPRIKFSEEAINELSKSIKEHGVIQPIVVRPIGDKFEIIAGERRYKASCMAGLKTIPALITDLNDKDSAEVALIENVQRENLTPIEEAISYRKILDMGYITQDALATKLGKTQSTIANKLRLLNLDDEVQEALLKERISERHARSLLRLTDKEQQKLMLNRIIEERLPVRRADEEIEKLLKNSNENIKETNQENIDDFSLNIEAKEDTEIPNFKFININNNADDTIKEQIDESEEIKPGKFFNILSDEEEPKEQETFKPSEAIEKFDFDNMFINPVITNQTNKINPNSSLLEELSEIERSINNSNNLPPLEPSSISQSKEDNTIKQEEPASIEKIDNIEDDELDFFELEEEKEETIVDEMEENNKVEEKDEPLTKVEEIKINDFKDILHSIRSCSNKIEEAGFTIETEEYDLEGMYQVVFKITKN